VAPRLATAAGAIGVMKRVAMAVVLAALLGMRCTAFAAGYSTQAKGTIQAYRFAGVEPDGDPLYQVALQMRLTASGGVPAANLVVSAYLENFSRDTTPILPDLLHPKQTVQGLGGYLDGKAILTDDAGDTVAIGIFLNEAFLDNTNHTVMKFVRTDPSAGSGNLKGEFTLHGKGVFTGHFAGTLTLPRAALNQIARHRGQRMKPLKDIVNQVTVHPHYYGTRGVHASGPAYNTGFAPSGTPSSGRKLSPLTIAAAIGAVVSLLLAGGLYWLERRRTRANRTRDRSVGL
jgi:hypothetical protein